MKSEDCHSRRVTNYLQARGQIAPSGKNSPVELHLLLEEQQF